MKPKPIHYEPHPVSPERRAELVAKGVSIVDAKFAPEDQKPKKRKTLTIKGADDAV